MTCHYSTVDWRDALYNSVRKAAGGVKAAAGFLTERRQCSIHPEHLRTRLRGVDGDSISMEMAELLTEWMQDARDPQALAWLKALNHRFGLVAMELPPAPAGGWACEIEAVNQKLLQLNVEGGTLTALGMKATQDKQLTSREAEEMSAQIMSEVELLLRLRRNICRAAGLEVQ